jgi:transposase
VKPMMSEDTRKNREQIQFFSMDDLVPKDHLLRLIEDSIDWSFIYDLVRDRYSEDQGRPSLDPVVLIKIPLIQYLYNIKSMRQTIKDIEVNMAYRWFLGLGVYDPVPHFTTFGKNYVRRFKETDLFEQIFERILKECFQYKLVDPGTIFIDATHIKAHANNHKFINSAAKQQALFYSDKLKAEIDKEREEAGKKPFKDKDDDGSGKRMVSQG